MKQEKLEMHTRYFSDYAKICDIAKSSGSDESEVVRRIACSLWPIYDHNGHFFIEFLNIEEAPGCHLINLILSIGILDFSDQTKPDKVSLTPYGEFFANQIWKQSERFKNREELTIKDENSKTFLKAIGFAGSLLLTLFAGLFAMVSLSAFVVSIIEQDLFSVMASAAAGFIAWMMWSIRKDTLV